MKIVTLGDDLLWKGSALRTNIAHEGKMLVVGEVGRSTGGGGGLFILSDLVFYKAKMAPLVLKF